MAATTGAPLKPAGPVTSNYLTSPTPLDVETYTILLDQPERGFVPGSRLKVLPPTYIIIPPLCNIPLNNTYTYVINDRTTDRKTGRAVDPRGRASLQKGRNHGRPHIGVGYPLTHERERERKKEREREDRTVRCVILYLLERAFGRRRRWDLVEPLIPPVCRLVLFCFCFLSRSVSTTHPDFVKSVQLLSPRLFGVHGPLLARAREEKGNGTVRRGKKRTPAFGSGLHTLLFVRYPFAVRREKQSRVRRRKDPIVLKRVPDG